MQLIFSRLIIFRFVVMAALLLFMAPSAMAQSNRDSVLADSLVQVARHMLDESPDTLKAVVLPDSVRRTDSLRVDTAGVRTDSSAAPPDTAAAVQPPAATRRISGIVRDKNTGEGIPFATVFFPRSPIGTPADLDGKFTLEFSVPPNDSIKAQALGYAIQSVLLSRQRDPQNIVLELTREAASLSEFVFHAGEDPAITLVKNIIRHKPKNNPDRLQQYRYEAYNKLEVDIQHLTKKQFESLPIPMIKQFSFIYNNLDSSSEETPFLPFFLTETLSDYYYRSSPKKTREFIKANQVKGIKNESIDKYLGTINQNINAYGNFIPIFDKSFVSPISDNGPFYYRYRIKDTQQAYGYNIILVQFSPRRPGENTFFGDFWVADSVFALQRISMEVPKDANINFVKRVSLYQEYAPVSDTAWFTVKDKFSSDFTLPYGGKLPGFIGRKTTTYQNIKIDDSTTTAVLNDRKIKDQINVAADSRDKGDDYWATARPESLSKNERAIYNMVDTLNALPSFQKFKNLIKIIGTGTVEYGPLEIGPLYNLYSSNPVEGPRFRLSLGTTPKLFKDAYLNGYMAYGTKDQAVKYSASILYLLGRKPRTYLYARHTHDINRSSANSEGEIYTGNLFSTIGRKPGIPWKLALETVTRVEYFREYPSGFSHMFFAQRRNFSPYSPLPSAGIFKDDEGQPMNSVTATEVGVRLRFAYHEDFLEGNYYRYSLGSGYPITELRLAAGIKGLLGSNYAYQRAVLSVNDEVKIAPFGKLSYNLFAGKIWGVLPYPLLEIHPGNEFYAYNPHAFNMMNNYEFLSDNWAGFFIEHNIGGGLFNYIPLLKKAKLRQFWTAKGIVGSATDSTEALNLNKGYALRTLEGSPYIELGTGVSNILQLFRIDFVWRVTPQPLRDEKKSRYFGIFGSVEFRF